MNRPSILGLHGQALEAPNKHDKEEEEEGHLSADVDSSCLLWKDQSGHTDSSSSRVPSTNINLEDVKVCSKCQVLLDQPTPSKKSPNLYTEERISGSSDEEEKRLCQRCNFDVVHSSTAHVLVPPDSYLNVLKPMTTRYSLVLVLVDVMEVPYSIHPSIMDVIGRDQPVIVVANKVDLLPLDAKQTLRTMWHNITEMMKSSVLASANIIDTVLVSAKTGFGITELRTLLQGQWRDNGDVFLVGGARSGKTSLFKALADSIGAHEHLGLAHRVKSYNWPLTNLELLKFKMKRVHGELRSLERGDLVERTVRPFKHLPSPVAARPSYPAPSDEDRSTPFFESRVAPLMLQDTTGRAATSQVEVKEQQRQKRGTWLYDTPSAVMPMQVLDLLTEEEVEFLTPRTVITPQTFRLRPNMSLFLAGLARIDVVYLHHPMPRSIGWNPHRNAKLTVYAAKCVPRTLVWTVNASSVYRDHLGDEVLMVPRGSAERLSQWPELAPQNFTATGPNEGVAAADIVLPSLGFVSVWLHPLTVCSLRVWTPGGRGAFLRSQSLLPHAIYLKGLRQKKGLVYDDHERFEEQKSNFDPSKPPSPERIVDVDRKSTHVQLREKLGYQRSQHYY
ncbi:P-loop containing nucleoside triphosphate hydrolase [Trinorchestia longiramus]|nr:P-loop containing nucleoside triphosphate hydrolase [Trinorchestia longiramus]